MTNLLNLPYDSNTKVFFVNGDDFQVWEKPNGAKLIHIICIGGGAGVAGGAITWGTLFISGGAGGGGTNTLNANGAGGAITAAGNPIFQTLSGGAAGGGKGSQGIDILGAPPISSGGSGGGAYGVSSGGRGGNGGFGSGGAGGGAGVTGGNGGRGGDGLVIITAI